MKNHKFAPTVQGFAGQIAGVSKTYEGGRGLVIDEAIPNAASDLQLDCDIDVSAVKSIIIASDKDITLDFNSTSVPAPTLALKAGVPYVWNTDSYDTLKLTDDVTTLYVSNASGATAQLRMEVVSDVTP